MNLKSVLIAAGTIFFSINSLAAVNATHQGTVTATVVAPFVFNQTVPFSFGSFQSSLSSALTITVSDDPNTAVSAPGVVGLSGTSYGEWTVASTELPSSVSIAGINLDTNPTSGHPMPCTFTTHMTADAAPNTEDIYLGGALTVNQNQPGGNYTGTYTLTVTYP